MPTQYVIIGGGVAGTTAAETIRRRDPEGSITIVSDEPYPFYSRVMLSKPDFFLGRIPEERIFLKKFPWYDEQRITLLKDVSATKLDLGRKTLTLSNGQELPYDKLLLATGSRVIRWTIPGADKQGIHYLRSLGDAKTLIADMNVAKRALAVGGGFISFEMCDLFRRKGLPTSVLVREPFFFGIVVDEPSGRIVEKAMKAGGVEIITDDEAVEVLGNERATGVKTKGGKTIDSDLLIVGIGTSCVPDFVRDGRVAVGRGIKANEYLETEALDVWAAGDCCEYHDILLEEDVGTGNWVHSQVQGRTAGMNMTAAKEPYRFVSFYASEGFGIAVAFVADPRPLPHREVIVRQPLDGNSRTRLLVEKSEVVGATLVGKASELAAIRQLIEKNVKVEPIRKQLADPSIDLKTLIPKA